MKLVAVIVNYNAGELLEKAVSAALEAVPPMLVVVADNDSSDNSLRQIELLAGDGARLKIVRNDSNLGFARANNLIIKDNPADYYALINPDCVIMPDAVGKIIDAMREDSSIGLASGTIRNTDGTIQKTCRRDFPTPWTGLARSLGFNRFVYARNFFEDFDRGGAPQEGSDVEYVEAISGAFMVVRGDALENVGMLDEGYFMHCEDLDWCMRFWQGGHKVAFVREAIAVHHKGGSGNSLRVTWHLHKGMLRFYRKFYRNEYPLPVMWMVYAGVAARFILKSMAVIITTAWQRVLGAGAKERAFE